jgi:SAM-dependent methyltransferase
MAVSCPIDLDTQLLRSEVSKVYSRVAADPDGDFHFHRGPVYAADFLGYDPVELAALPSECTASFAGIANPHAIDPIVEGEMVLDIGCGAGMDLLLAARRVGPTGRAIGVDMTDAMRDRARASAAASGLTNVEVQRRFGRCCRRQWVSIHRMERRIWQKRFVAIGERLSALMIAPCLNAEGTKAEAVNAAQLIVTDAVFGGASPLMEQTTENGQAPPPAAASRCSTGGDRL